MFEIRPISNYTKSKSDTYSKLIIDHKTNMFINHRNVYLTLPVIPYVYMTPKVVSYLAKLFNKLQLQKEFIIIFKLWAWLVFSLPWSVFPIYNSPDNWSNPTQIFIKVYLLQLLGIMPDISVRGNEKNRININYTSHCRPDQNWIPADAGNAAQWGSKPGTTVRQRQLPVASCSSRLWQFQVPWAHISLARLGASQTERSRTAHKAANQGRWRFMAMYGQLWLCQCLCWRSISKKSFRLSWVRRKTCHFYFNDQRWSKMSAQANATTISLLSYFFNCLLFFSGN